MSPGRRFFRARSRVYTELARRARVTGTVILEAVIDEHGDVTDAKVLKVLPMGLSQAALDAVKTWKFKREGQPVPVYYVMTVNFQMEGAPFGSGPIFSKFLEQNPEFAAQLRPRKWRLEDHGPSRYESLTSVSAFVWSPGADPARRRSTALRTSRSGYRPRWPPRRMAWKRCSTKAGSSSKLG
ncbi:MAG: energy transducer TonB [Thermoanaerobaculia bacterium]